MGRSIMIGVAGMAALLPLPLPAQQPELARAHAFVQHLEQAEWAAADAMVSPAMRTAGVTPAMLEQSWAQLSAAGPFAMIGVESVTASGELRIVDFSVRFGAQPLKLRVVVDAEDLITGFRVFPATPPPYVAPAYVDTASLEEMAVEIGEAPWVLGGTLTLPRGVASPPVVVLVHGSGPHDRDETIGRSRPFRDLAWGLASRGVAVLRYDKRSLVHGARMASGPYTIEEEVVADALAALAAARAHPRTDSARVYLLGHSLGGFAAPEIAVRDGRVAGTILLAGTPRWLPEVVLEQLTHLGTLPANQGAAAVARLAEMRAAMEGLIRREYADTAQVFGATAAYYYDLRERDPAGFAARFAGPVLVLQGGRDYQVTRRDYDLWREALAASSVAEFRFYDDLNHLFVSGAGTALPEEYLSGGGSVDERVIADVARFIVR